MAHPVVYAARHVLPFVSSLREVSYLTTVCKGIDREWAFVHWTVADHALERAALPRYMINWTSKIRLAKVKIDDIARGRLEAAGIRTTSHGKRKRAEA